MAKLSNKPNNEDELSLEELGLEGTEGAETPSEIPATEESIKKADVAMQNAAATAALKAAVVANNEMAVKEAEKTYIIEKKKYMLNKCKEDDVVEFVGQKIFANYFGPVYTFLFNTIPVTVRFDGTKQKLPRFIYNRLMEKINEVSESNTNKIDIEDRRS